MHSLAYSFPPGIGTRAPLSGQTLPFTTLRQTQLHRRLHECLNRGKTAAKDQFPQGRHTMVFQERTDERIRESAVKTLLQFPKRAFTSHSGVVR